jgi:hypothetical protein
MHALNKQDEYHRVITSKPDAYAALSGDSTTTADSTQGESEESTSATFPEAGMPTAEDGGDEDGDSDREAECPNCGEGLEMTEEEAAAFLRTNTVDLPSGESVNGGFCGGCGHLLRVDS